MPAMPANPPSAMSATKDSGSSTSALRPSW
jgi:hypothetical protein